MTATSFILRTGLACAAAALAGLSSVHVDQAVAQSQTGAFAGYSADSKKPIDIEADQLEVDDKKQLAIFRGNVTATQGEFNMRSKELHVTYASAAAKAKPEAVAAPIAAPAPAGPNADIKYIEAKGKVFITSKGEQSATGDNAIFDVKAQTVTITGDVTVTQKENIIKGEKLLIDIASGKSTFLTNDGSASNAVKGRIKAQFTAKSNSGEEDGDKKKDKAAAPKAPKTAPAPAN